MVKVTGVVRTPYKETRAMRKNILNGLHGDMLNLVGILSALAEKNMKIEARWTDRTGDARRALYADYEFKGGSRRRRYRVIMGYRPNMPNFARHGFYPYHLETVVFSRKGYLGIVMPSTGMFITRYRKIIVGVLRERGYNVG